ncbi:MAG TPA: sugar transferase [Polyangiaceae bacterium]|jgi:lipopolysaccharide/colanic/teichoic acid biosynthesis glycosyltransferase|nr:sugar transferase [Polyangiaceae bacterium]
MSITLTSLERSFYQIFRVASPGSRTIPLSVRITKRSIDVLFALIGLTLFAVLLPFLAVAMRLDSRGPIFYRQRRASTFVGRSEGGRYSFAEFDMIKLRTMRVDAESRTGAVLAAENDPRVTRIGRILRKSRLDELPQLWNVLKGDMSLVGPRPERTELLQNLALTIPFFEERMRECKPGITGLAQISLGYLGRPSPDSPIAALQDSLVNPMRLDGAEGSIADDMRNKLLFDLAYVAGLEQFVTFAVMELLVIAKTPWVMVRGLGR